LKAPANCRAGVNFQAGRLLDGSPDGHQVVWKHLLLSEAS